MTTTVHHKVLIIGAGLGGLSLAQIFRRHNVPFEIFERTEAVEQTRQGWAVGLVEAVPLLAKYLPDDMGDIQQTSVNWGVREPDSVGILDGRTGTLIFKMGGVPHGQRGYFLRANREQLRSYLSENLNVTTGKQFVRYVEDSTGVTALFADGTSARGSILIGADGASSVVRTQLLGADHKPQVNDNIPLNGMCELPRAEYEHLRQLGNSVLFTTTPNVFFNIGLCSIQPDRELAQYYWGVTFRSGNPAADSKWAQEADRETLYNKAVELISDLPPWLTGIVSKTGPKGMTQPCIRFLEYVPPETMTKGGRVTLLGDAAHTMIPFKGAGANTAVTDSCDLGQLIVQALDENGIGWAGLTGVLDEYNAIMLPRGRETVLLSRRAGESENSTTALMKGRAVVRVEDESAKRNSV